MRLLPPSVLTALVLACASPASADAVVNRALFAPALHLRAADMPAPNETLRAIAGAVEGVESSHGTNPRMWRPEPQGPQGPMQVSAAAAIDVGGGNRFDPAENRILGRAYLAHMYRRFGSWADAVAAYDWGPGRMDSWIRGGRPAAKFPAEVARYRMRVLFASASPGLPGALPARPRRAGIVHAQPHAAGRPNPHDPVNRLYAEVMAASVSR